MTPEKEKKFEESLERIEKAIVGDPAIGLTGLVPRVGKLEHWVRRADIRIATVTGAGFGIWFLIEKFILN